jgi:hypothetical protein
MPHYSGGRAASGASSRAPALTFLSVKITRRGSQVGPHGIWRHTARWDSCDCSVQMPRAAGPAVGAFAGSGNRAARRSSTSAVHLSSEHKALSCRRLTDMPAAWSCDCSKATGFRYALTPRQALRTALCECLHMLHPHTRPRP